MQAEEQPVKPIMVSDPSPMANEVNDAAEKEGEGSLPNSKKQGKVPKKVHKAEREKLKRDQLNELFLELGHVLEPERQNNCKASILGDTTRVIKDLFTQVESLRKENTALISESHYITLERNELKDENSTLQAEISSLQNTLQGRRQPDPVVWSSHADASPHILTQPNATVLPMQPQPLVLEPINVNSIIERPTVNPIRVLQLFPESRTSPSPPASPRPSSGVRRPNARYPTHSDSWPEHLLSMRPRDDLRSSSSISTTDSKEKEDSDGMSTF